MAPPVKAEAVFVPLKNCFVNLPSNLVTLLSNNDSPIQDVIVELQYRSQTISPNAVSSGNATGFQRSAYVGWTGMPSKTRQSSMLGNERSRGAREQEGQTVEIDPAYARVMGLSEGQQVGLLVHLNPPLAYTVHVEPRTPADWEMIELHANFLELNFLSQIRAIPNPLFTNKTSTQVEQAHPLTLHLSPTSTANLIVSSLNPALPSTQPFAKIDPARGEVIVAPKTRPTSGRSNRADVRSTASRRSGKSALSTRTSTSKKSARSCGEVFLRGLDLQVAKSFINAEHEDVQHQLTIWLSPAAVSSEALKGSIFVAVSVAKPAGLRAQPEQDVVQRLKEEDSSEVGRPSSKIVVRLSPWTNALDNVHAILSPRLSEILGISNFSGLLIRVEAVPLPLARNQCRSFSFYPFAPQTTRKREGLQFGGDSRAAKQAVADRLKITHATESGLLNGPLTDGMVIPASGDSGSSLSFDGGILRFNTSGERNHEGDRDLIWALGAEQRHDFQVKDEIPNPTPITTLFPTFSHGLPSTRSPLVGVEAVLKKSMSNLTLCSSVLLTGGIGSGKTCVTHELGHRLREDYLFNVTYLSCQTLVNDETRVSSVKETLTRMFASGSWCARLGGQSVVILDDLDKICPVETELQVGNDNGRSRQLTEVLCAVVRKYCSIQGGVALLATAQSKDSLNNIVIGGHVIGDIVSIKAPTKEIRRGILHSIVFRETSTLDGDAEKLVHSRHPSDSHSITESSWMNPSNPSSSRPASSSSSAADGFRVSPSLDLLDIASKTDGYMPADLLLLTARARNECLSRLVSSIEDESASENLTLSKIDFEEALRNFTPASLRNVTLTRSSTTFSAIGGLKETRDTLLETLLYPTKYAPIFARSPLRLRSGLLLYGYPGCGKTLLASAVAGECNLNFISVKGPEILNKYIGASEKSVRDLFERAQAAKPCVLFFDEFDSIAPKRGHDSTGVTDRVVNQMLTQMDGAEGLDGVYVLAATSRPDLIDPALLRPGRLDKSLLCDMPDQVDREDILKAVSDKLHLNQTVLSRLPDIALQTKGFTGADLQALMYNAHLEAIHDLLGDQNQHSIDQSDTRAKDKLINGTKGEQQKHGRNKRGGSNSTGDKQQDFIQFLYGTEEDEAARRTISASAVNSPATIATKLEELKRARKRERAIMKGQRTEKHGRPGSEVGKNDKDEGQDRSNVAVVIEWRHVERSLATTRSSISPQERRRLQAIYDEFVQGRNGEMPNADGNREVGGRTSLM